ncbi:MAG TPA: hypothetical protein VHG92_03500, partial [Afifellaceae bacterium]|nr:hypothetical protein [Afifellaceae bacterium]
MADRRGRSRNRRSRQHWAGLLAAALLASLAPAGAAAGPALLVDAASGRVLHAHEIFRPWHPASLTKLMTLYAVFAAMEAGRVAP